MIARKIVKTTYTVYYKRVSNSVLASPTGRYPSEELQHDVVETDDCKKAEDVVRDRQKMFMGNEIHIIKTIRTDETEEE
jgi:hypothetical protein